MKLTTKRCRLVLEVLKKHKDLNLSVVAKTNSSQAVIDVQKQKLAEIDALIVDLTAELALASNN